MRKIRWITDKDLWAVNWDDGYSHRNPSGVHLRGWSMVRGIVPPYPPMYAEAFNTPHGFKTKTPASMTLNSCDAVFCPSSGASPKWCETFIDTDVCVYCQQNINVTNIQHMEPTAGVTEVVMYDGAPLGTHTIHSRCWKKIQAQRVQLEKHLGARTMMGRTKIDE
jgi:hypothetical protein